MSRKTKEEKRHIKDLIFKCGIIEERIEFMRELKDEIESSGGVAFIQLGGIVDDLQKINPLTQQKVVSFLLALYEDELVEHNQVLKMCR